MRAERELRVAFVVVLAALLGTALLAPAAGARTRTEHVQTALEAEIAAAINELRAQSGVRALRPSRQLTRAARRHVRSMARLGYFSHSSANGKTATRRITGFYRVRGATSWDVGEVIAWTPGLASATRVTALWLASPGHRRQLLQRRWREIGVGAVSVSAAPGVYGGRDVTIVVVDFGFRRR